MQVDVGKIIDGARLNRLHYLVLGIGLFVLIVDSYDLVSMGIVIPRIAEQWGIETAEFGVALSISMVGVLIGSGASGLLGDYIGRKKTTILTVGIAGVFMLLTMTATTMNELLVYRFLTGFGAGGCIPITIALASEFMPERVRNRLVVLMYTGAGMGSVFAGFAAPYIMAEYGWRGIFGVGGVVSLAVMALVMFLLPESVKFMIATGTDGRKVGQLLQRVDPDFETAGDDEYVIREHTQAEKGSPVRELFGEGQTGITLLAWAVMLGNQFMVFALGLWMPTLLTQGGLTERTALSILAFYNIGGVAGGWAFAAFADKYDPARVLTITYPLAGVATVSLGYSLSATPVLVAVAIVTGFFIIGSSFCLGPYVASLYPTRARSTGIGWALSVGRIGSILSPLVAGWAIGQGFATSTILYVAGLPPVLCGLVVVWLRRLEFRVLHAENA